MEKMIDTLKNIEKNILSNLLDYPDIWNTIDIKSYQPRTYMIWTKYEDNWIYFCKSFYCKESTSIFKKANDDIIIHFLDGFWELYNFKTKFKADDNSYLTDKELEFNTKCFLIKKDSKYYFRSYKQKDWIYSILLSKSVLNIVGNPLNNEIKLSLLRSAKILIS